MKVHVVPHSHWDREWYFNIEDSNILLGENLTHLMDFLEEEEGYPSYSFDAQASILDEYVKVYPENRERLKKLIEDRRVFVGPWYTQTDSLLVNKESIIRNLQYGIHICEEYGHSMEVGYLPDIFGQNQYLPSIFRGFGIEDAIFQRGVYTDQLQENLNFSWVSPDGNKVRANNIYLGYGPGKFLASDDEYINEKLLPMLDRLKKLNRDCTSLLLPAGGDQVLVREHFKEVVHELNSKELGYEFVLSNYEDFMKEAWSHDNFTNEIAGELRACEKSRIHRTIGSQRYDIKEANSRVENKILRVLEPLAVIGQEVGIEYPQRWLDICWKLLFDVHAHDSIGGCNSDSTNAEIMNRLGRVEKIADGLINIIKKKIVTGISRNLGREDIATIFNTRTSQTSRGRVVVFTRENHPTLSTLDGKDISQEIRVSEYISGGKIVVVTVEGDREEELPGYYRSEIEVQGITIPALGYTTLIVAEGEGEDVDHTSMDTTVENDHYILSVEDGRISLTTRSDNRRMDDILSFESCTDAGDSYDFSPAKGDKGFTFRDFQVVKVEKASTFERLQLVSEIDEERRFTIYTTIELPRTSKTLNITHRLENHEENHRLRAVVDTGLRGVEHSYSDSGFSLIEHGVVEERLKRWREDGFAEAPVPIYNLENLVLIRDEKKQLEVYTQGIKEYEVVDNSLALTLFRSVGLLGRDNLMWRPGRASGINNKIVTTPDAQMKGEFSFRYGIVVGDIRSTGDTFRGMDDYLSVDTAYQLQTLNTFEERVERFEIPRKLEDTPAEISLLEIDNENLLVSVIKRAHVGNAKIVRIYNPGNTEEGLHFQREVTEVDLKEDPISHGREFTIGARGYKTFKIK